MKKDNYKGFFKYLKKTFFYAGKKEKLYLFLFFIVTILICGVNVIGPILTARQIVYLTDSLWTQLFAVTIAIFVTEIGRNFLRTFGNIFIGKYYLGIKATIQVSLARETLKIKTETMNENSSGMFVERMGQDVSSMIDIFVSLIDYATSFVSGVGVLIAIFFVNKMIFFLYLIFVIVLFVIQYYNSEEIQKVQKENRKISEDVTGFATELVRGSKDIKLLNAESSFLRKARSEVDRLNKSDYEVSISWGKFRLMSASLWDLVDLCIISIGIYFVFNKQLSIASMLVLFNYRWHILDISYTFERLVESIKKYVVSAERVFDILDGKKFKKEKFGNIHLNKLKGYIEFKNTDFSYKKGNQVLNNVNFKITPNKTVAFVGKSGSGKSTIFNLISKLYTVKSGMIFLDNVDINKLDRETIRGNISVISQNPYIFNMSIKDNLKVIREDITDDEIISACKMADLHDFIVSLKDGYDTMVGEGGITLSGGQRQRLAIARALIQNTEIILFDEATSALDNETQDKIQKAINNMQGVYTILIIAHRLSTVMNADIIYLIDDGKVAGIGSHEELLKNNEIYRKLYEFELK